MNWQRYQSSEFRIAVFEGPAGVWYDQQVPGHIPDGLTAPAEGALHRGQFCWAAVRGQVRVQRLFDSADYVVGPDTPLSRTQVATLQRFTLLTDDSRIVCISARDPSVWWDRERFLLSSGETLTLPAADAERRLFVARGAIQGPRSTVGELGVATLPAGMELTVTASADTYLIVLTYAGSFTFDPPDDVVLGRKPGA